MPNIQTNLYKYLAFYPSLFILTWYNTIMHRFMLPSDRSSIFTLGLSEETSVSGVNSYKHVDNVQTQNGPGPAFNSNPGASC